MRRFAIVAALALVPVAAVTEISILRSLEGSHCMRRCRHAPAQVAEPAPVVVKAQPPRDDDATRAVRDVARAIETCWRDGRRDLAETIASAHAEVVDWSSLAGLATVSCAYESSAGRLALSVNRAPGTNGPVAVTFGPGTYGTATHDVQELALMRGTVLVLPSGAETTSALVPIACASFERNPPHPDQSYELRRFDRGSDVDRLMCGLCAGAGESEPEAQLAIWIVRNGLTPAEFLSKPRVVTFESERPVRLEHAKGAAVIMRSCGIDPERTPFFEERLRPAPRVPRQPAPVIEVEGPVAS